MTDFEFRGEGTIQMNFIMDKKLKSPSTSLSLDKRFIFFSREYEKDLRENQKVIFSYGLKDSSSKEEKMTFLLRLDSKDNHINFDLEINGKLANHLIPSNLKKEGKKLKKFFLHTIKSMPKNLKIEIYFISKTSKKLIKKYEKQIKNV